MKTKVIRVNDLNDLLGSSEIIKITASSKLNPYIDNQPTTLNIGINGMLDITYEPINNIDNSFKKLEDSFKELEDSINKWFTILTIQEKAKIMDNYFKK